MFIVLWMCFGLFSLFFQRNCLVCHFCHILFSFHRFRFLRIRRRLRLTVRLAFMTVAGSFHRCNHHFLAAAEGPFISSWKHMFNLLARSGTISEVTVRCVFYLCIYFLQKWRWSCIQQTTGVLAPDEASRNWWRRRRNRIFGLGQSLPCGHLAADLFENGSSVEFLW